MLEGSRQHISVVQLAPACQGTLVQQGMLRKQYIIRLKGRKRHELREATMSHTRTSKPTSPLRFCCSRRRSDFCWARSCSCKPDVTRLATAVLSRCFFEHLYFCHCQNLSLSVPNPTWLDLPTLFPSDLEAGETLRSLCQRGWVEVLQRHRTDTRQAEHARGVCPHPVRHPVQAGGI